LDLFYQSTGGGLMVAGMDLAPKAPVRHELAEAYKEAGLKRERRLLSIKQSGSLRAVVMVDIADVALNMSDLTNCMKIFVTESEMLPRDILKTALTSLADHYEQNRVPVLIYPQDYAEKQSLPTEKLYNLWVLNMEYSDSYFQFIDQLNQLRDG
jgi:hypothetical protein